MCIICTVEREREGREREREREGGGGGEREVMPKWKQTPWHQCEI